jgi:hypothetical protein
MATDGIGPNVKPRKPLVPGLRGSGNTRELLNSEDVKQLGMVLSSLDAMGVRLTGSLEFKGHVVPVAYDSTESRHYISF